MNSPYMGRFQITQAFTSEHDGLDLVGLDSKQIHSTVNGTVIHAGWENPSNHSQGFGLYVCIRVGNQDYYYGHMSQIYVSVGQTVKITDIIGLEGSTGYSTGSHCHYCCRVAGTMTPLDINAISGIPNVVGGVYDDGASGGNHSGRRRYIRRHSKWWNFKRRFSIVLSKRWKLDNLYKSSNVEYGWYQNPSDKSTPILPYLSYTESRSG